MGVEVSVLGLVEARVAGERVDVGGPKQRGVLAALAVDANQPVTTSTLIERVWGDSAESKSALYSYVKRLRAELGQVSGIRLGRVSGGYFLEIARDQVDLHRFRELTVAASAQQDLDQASARWAQALALWRGLPFEGLTSPWFDRLRDALERDRLTAVVNSNDTELKRGRHAQVLSRLRELADEHPLDERIAGQLVLAAYRSGRQREALEHYHQVRQRLGDELGVQPVPELAALYLRILRHDNELAVPVPVISVSAAPLTPAQLPHDIDGFVGRERELEQLASMPGTIRLIDGLGGVGKTALAIRFAHRCVEQFPDGQLYVDLRGFGPNCQPLEPDAAIGRFLRALDVPPHRIPADHAELVTLYRSVLARRRMLILLDNALTAEQVRPLLPGTPDCHVLITSRSRLAGLSVRDGARRITLRALPQADAVALLAHVVGQERVAAQRDAAEQMARNCGCLPLALRVAADRAAAMPCPDMADLADELTGEHRRLDVLASPDDDTVAIRAVFWWSYRLLPPDQAAMFRLLGLHAGEQISDEAAAVLAAVPIEISRLMLDRLTAMHLIEQNDRHRRRMHDLMRLYAAERATAEEAEKDRVRAVLRLVTWYLHSADNAGGALVPPRRRGHLAPLEPGFEPRTFPDARSALAWCETERGNLMLAARQAADLGLHSVAWQFPSALWDFFYLRSHWADWITMHENGLVSARLDGDALGEAGVLLGLGHAYEQVGRFEQASRTLAAALPIWRELGDTWGQGMTEHTLAAVYKGLGRFVDSVRHYQRALALHHQFRDQWALGWTLTNLGSAYRQLGRLDSALEVTSEACAVLGNIGDRQGHSRSLNDLAAVHLARGCDEKAVRGYERALLANQEIASRRGEAWSHRGLGNALHSLGRTSQATTSWRSALAIFEELGDETRAADVRARLRHVF